MGPRKVSPLMVSEPGPAACQTKGQGEQAVNLPRSSCSWRSFCIPQDPRTYTHDIHLGLSLQPLWIWGLCSEVFWILVMPHFPGDSQGIPVSLWPFKGTQWLTVSKLRSPSAKWRALTLHTGVPAAPGDTMGLTQVRVTGTTLPSMVGCFNFPALS